MIDGAVRVKVRVKGEGLTERAWPKQAHVSLFICAGILREIKAHRLLKIAACDKVELALCECLISAMANHQHALVRLR